MDGGYVVYDLSSSLFRVPMYPYVLLLLVLLDVSWLPRFVSCAIGTHLPTWCGIQFW